MIRIARVISRLNVGGPGIQAITTTRMLEADGYRTLLIRGSEGPDEGSLDDLADALGVRPVRIGTLRREVGPHDLRAVAAVARVLSRFRPDIVHTHAAKGGAVGRTAALMLRRRPPVLVHTFHGQSLEGYFSPRRAAAFRTAEQLLARRTDRIVAVSAEVRADLLRLGVAAAEKISVVPLGFDLSAFNPPEQRRAETRTRLRAEWGIADDAPVAVLIARLVPIKRVDRFLAVAAGVADRLPGARFVVVGDGELRRELMAAPAAGRLGSRVVWAGMRRDVRDVLCAADAVLLTSDNEGTPVSLIEAQAARVPAVSTDVGGTRAVVLDGVTGYVAPRDDVDALVGATVRLLRDPDLRRRLGDAGHQHVVGRFSLDRLCADLDGLYRTLIAQRPPRASDA